MGIFGLGRIGSAAARRAKEFDMHIIYHTRQGRNIQIDNELGAKYVRSYMENMAATYFSS
jgi:lactate dehydrogenase-like 2-hydroxyacid dehydrogenase